jgi:hypothetical protein
VADRKSSSLDNEAQILAQLARFEIPVRKEYELAWSLRARRHFLSSPVEREAILAGYGSSGTYDAATRRPVRIRFE